MSFKLSDAAHAISSFFSDGVKHAKGILAAAVKFGHTAEDAAPVIEEITGLMSPQVELAERAAFSLLGLALKAYADAQAAGGSDGLSLTLDKAFLADLAPLHDAAVNAAEAAGFKIGAPAANAAPAPAPAPNTPEAAAPSPAPAPAPAAAPVPAAGVAAVVEDAAAWVHGLVKKVA